MLSNAQLSKQRRKARALDKHREAQLKVDRRTSSERGYDDAVQSQTTNASVMRDYTGQLRISNYG